MIWLSLALAGLPPWVEVIQVPPTGGPPSDACEGTVASVSPGGPGTSGGGSDAPPPGTETMLRYDITAGAANDQLPDELREQLQLGQPFDLARVPIEPFRGRSGDVARVKQLLQDAQLGQRRVRIAAWGASHVAGEYFTGGLRRLLQAAGGDGGHGFLLPAAPWKGYRASDVNLCTRGTWVSDYVDRPGGRGDGKLGAFGISVEASTPASSAWIQTTTSNPQGRTVTRFEVHFLRQPTGGSLDLVVDDAAPVRVSTRGASGPGAVFLDVDDGPHRLTLTPAGDGPVRIVGASMEREGTGAVVDAAGVVGRTATSWLGWDEELQRDFLSLHPPDLAIIAYGTNEANDSRLSPETYREQLRATLVRFRAVLPRTACVLVGPSDRGKKVSGNLHVIWSRTEWVAATQREIAPEFGCVSWDLQAATGGPGSVFRWRELQPPLMAPDLLHFSAEGYKELARRFVEAAR